LGFEQQVPIVDDILNVLVNAAKVMAEAISGFVRGRTSF
jgi:hypothetical protein